MRVRSRSVGLGMRRVLAAAALGVVVLTALPSCEEAETPHPCTSIPTGGCPRSRGVACEDLACEAVYACRPGNVWELDRLCPPRDGGPPRDGSAEASDARADAPIDAARSFDASYDGQGANGGPGCAGLQGPDCSLGFALACPAGCCGCEDLFTCESSTWTFYATCRE